MKKKTHSCVTGFKVSRMHSCVLELSGDLSRQGQPNGTGKDRASGAGSSSLHVRTRADSGWGWQSRLELDAEQGPYGRTRINAGQA